MREESGERNLTLTRKQRSKTAQSIRKVKIQIPVQKRRTRKGTPRT